MQLGWIDFSDSDRKKTMDVLRLFQEQGAVDELGIGVIRDGFANYFFPGTSTIHTRAKYFFIIPYAMMDVVSDPRITSVQHALRRLDEIEKESAEILKRNSGELGVIGATILPKWVVRTPSTIYWNALRTLGIFNGGLLHNLTISEYFRLALKQRDEKAASASMGNRKEGAEENELDDIDAGDIQHTNFWHLTYEKGWKNNLKIELTPSEADYLSTRIKASNPNSVYAFILRESIDIEQYANFPAFSYDLKPKLDEENANMLDLADSFNDFVGLAQIRYNLLLSDWQNEDAVRLWEDEKDNAIEYAKRVDLDAIFSLLHLNNPGLRDFLFKFRDAIISGNWETDADNAILKQEIRIKGGRAKLKNKSKYPQDKWIGGYRLDYRFTDARRIIMDIRNAQEHV